MRHKKLVGVASALLTVLGLGITSTVSSDPFLNVFAASQGTGQSLVFMYQAGAEVQVQRESLILKRQIAIMLRLMLMLYKIVLAIMFVYVIIKERVNLTM